MGKKRWLRATSPEIINRLEKFARDWPYGRVGVLSDLALRDLKRIIGNERAVRLIDIQCHISQFHDAEDHRDLRKAVLRLLHAQGTRLPRGKKPRPEMEAMVEQISGLMAAFGMPEACGENSRMVQVLRLVASDLSMHGDPRDELRRQIRLAKAQTEDAERLVREVLSRGLAPLRSPQPPSH